MTAGLRFEVQWASAERAKPQEHAATWARFRVFVEDECLTLVEERGTRDLRNWLDVSLYPLAEWIAFNWWFLTTPCRQSGALSAEDPASTGGPFGGREAAKATLERFNMTFAGEGFPWPDTTIIPESQYFLLSSAATGFGRQRVRFLSNGLFVLDFADAVGALRQFVDMVVRRLDDKGVADTPLQHEWVAIEGSDYEVAQFCRAAAAFGFDPYDLPAGLEEALLGAGRDVSDFRVLVELLGATTVSTLSPALEWFRRSLEAAQAPGRSTDINRAVQQLGREPQFRDYLQSARIRSSTPWREGYVRARKVREALHVAATRWIDLDPLVEARPIDQQAPGFLEALGRASGTPIVVVPTHRSPSRQRFLQARAYFRSLVTGQPDTFLITRGLSLRDKVERAFAAELLAPAAGLSELLDGDYSETSRDRAAEELGASRQVIDRQIENQLMSVVQ